LPRQRAIAGEADLVEEVARINGFDAIPSVSLPRMTSLPGVALTPTQKRAQNVKRFLAQRGLNEAVTFSFMPSKLAKLFSPEKAPVLLANPISADLDAMRPSILGTLLEAAGRNASRGFGDLSLFEVGPVFTGAAPQDQFLVAAGIRVGKTPRHWRERQRPFDAYDAKADALALLGANAVPIDNLQVTSDAPGYFHPGQSAQLRLGNNVLARFGAIHPRVLGALDIAGSAAGFEIFLDRLPQPRQKGTARPLLDAAPFQPIERDFAFVVDAAMPAEKLVKAARGADKDLIVAIGLFDVFMGESVGAGKKSIALSVTLQPRARTLTDAEIEAVSARIVSAVNKATGAELRK
jgi:phenylalanyl-tRNA synthetase beta chain